MLPTVRRRVWPVLLPLVLVIALAIAWTGLWFYAASAAEAKLAGWRERQARIGRIYTCGEQTLGGYPFRIEVRCSAPTVELRRDDPPVALKAADLLVAAQVYDPTLLISEFTGPMSIAPPGEPPRYIANWTLGQSSARGTPAAPERVSIVVDHPIVERTAGAGATNAGPATVLKADRIELHGRVAEGSTAGNPAIELVLRLNSAAAPGLHPLAARPLDAEIAATLRGLTDLSPKPMPVRLRELQARGGRIEIASARVQQGEAIAAGSGSLGLTARGTLDGQLQVTIVGLEQIVKSLDVESLVSQGQIGETIGSLDRLMPGLGQLARQNAAPSVIVGLRAMGRRTTLDGKPAITLPLRFVDGQVLLGPLALARVPALF